MKKNVVSRSNQIKSIILIIVLMAITVYALLGGYSIQDLIQVMSRIHPYYLLMGFCMMVLYFLCQAMNFNIILTALKQPVKYRRCIEYTCTGFYFGSITPGASASQPAQMYYMNKEGISVAQSSITIFYMVFVYQIAMILFGAAMVLINPGTAAYSASKLKYLLLAGIIVTVGLIFILTALMYSKRLVPLIIAFVIDFLSMLHIIKKPSIVKEKMENITASYHDKSKILRKYPGLFFRVFTMCILQLLALCMVSYFVYLSMGYRDYKASDLVTSQILLSISTTAVPIPGSVGAAEQCFLLIFKKFYSLSILPSAMLLSRGINFYLPLFLSFVLYLFTHIRVMKQGKKNPPSV